MNRLPCILPLLFFLVACSTLKPPSAGIGPDGVAEVTARGLTLEGPEEIPAGWTTFRFINESPMVHFALIQRMPEGHDIRSQQEEVAPVFQQGMDLLAAGKVDAALAKFGELPAWSGEIVYLGGPGFTSAGLTSQASVYMEPGTYVMECYVKTGGVFHSYNPDPDLYGMVHQFTVTREKSGRAEPVSDLQLSISAAGGIEITGRPSVGRQTVAVHFADQKPHENFVGHDVHLVRLGGGVDIDELEAWMDWSRPDGLQTPAPAQFLGGLNELPAGSTGYFTVTLAPGDYAWISEVPGSRGKGMLKSFRVD